MITAKDIPDFKTERFFSKFIKGKKNECWVWGGTTESSGYGVIIINKSRFKAHRVSYHIHYGSISKDLCIDHICRNKSCVNPSHLRNVTTSTNLLEDLRTEAAKNKAKTHCIRGHEFVGVNVKIVKNGTGIRRHCIPCQKYLAHRWYLKMKKLGRR